MEINKNIMSGIVEKIVLSTLLIILIGYNLKKKSAKPYFFRISFW